MANPLDKFELGIRKLIESLMIERMSENDKIVTRYMADHEFQASAFPILAREIFETVRGTSAVEGAGDGTGASDGNDRKGAQQQQATDGASRRR
jgi:type I restriction enzyme R subunit